MPIAELLNKLTQLKDDVGTPTSDDLMTLLEALATTWANVTQGEADTLIANCDAPISDISGGALKTVKLTSGTSWTHPSDLNAEKAVTVTLVAGGGSGGKESNASHFGGGGGGGEIIMRVPMILTGSSTSYSVDPGGAAKTSAGDGNPASTTTFNGLECIGGTGGLGTGNNAGGVGGGRTATGISREFRLSPADGGRGWDGSVNAAPGEDGALGTGGAQLGINAAGSGAGSWGDGGSGGSSGAAPTAGVEGGGGGGSSTGDDSGAGGAGFILIEYQAT